MGFLGKKWNELVYTLTSNDRYAGYHSSKALKSLDDSNNIPKKHEISHYNDNNNDDEDNKYADDDDDDDIDDIELEKNFKKNHTVEERQQAQLVLDSWHIIEDVINVDLPNFQISNDADIIDDIPDASDFINSLSSPCTSKDLNVAQKHLGVQLPYPVIQSFLIHDGQEIPPSMSTKLGIFYGLQLLSLEEVIIMTRLWRKVATRESNAKSHKQNQQSISSFKEINEDKNEAIVSNDPNIQFANKVDQLSQNNLNNYPDLMRNVSTHSKNYYRAKLPIQKSFPKGHIKCQYANPNWIPLVTDNAGNHIAIDMDPDIDGSKGQVIIFGRDFDTKYVIAPNWAQFLVSFTKDFQIAEKCNLDYDPTTGQFDLAYVDKNGNTVDQGYLYVLSQRVQGNEI